MKSVQCPWCLKTWNTGRRGGGMVAAGAYRHIDACERKVFKREYVGPIPKGKEPKGVKPAGDSAVHLANWKGLSFCGQRDGDMTFDVLRVQCKFCLRLIEKAVHNEQNAERRNALRDGREPLREAR